MDRRQFNRIVLWGGASTVATRLFWPKPAEAYTTQLSLRSFSSSLVFRSFQQYSRARALPGTLDRILKNRDLKQVNQGEALVIRSSDQRLRNNGYVQGRTELARANQGYTSSLLWGRQRRERVGLNPGFGFVQESQGRYFDSRLSGPTMGGIYRAQQILSSERVRPDDIAASVLPIRSTYEDKLGWNGEGGSNVGFVQYMTASGEVTVRYDAQNLQSGGRGRILITLEGDAQPRRRIVVWVS